VVIYANKSSAMTIARDLVVANTGAFPEYAQVKQADPLPGSLCELARLHPRVNTTPIPLDPFTPDPHAATVFGAINAISSGGLVSTYGEATTKLGWTPLRNDDPRFTIVESGAIGVLRTLKNPLPTFEQFYDMTDRGAPIMFRQEPESYQDFERQQTTHEHIGAWDVELFTDFGDAGAVFYSGTTILGMRIRVVCFAPRSDGYILDDIREFVRTLGTG
jgi:hypothetical protein